MTDNSITITGKAGWNYLFNPDPKFNKYRLDLLLDKEGIAQAKKLNLRIKTYDGYKDLFDGFDGSYIRAETDGETKNPPRIYDAKAKKLKESVGVGHGSDVILKAGVKTYDFTSKKQLSPAEAQKKWGGYGLFLNAVQITNLIKYEGNSDFVPTDGSFSSEETGEFSFDEGDPLPEFDKAS